jgi:hypothetical protein
VHLVHIGGQILWRALRDPIPVREIELAHGAPPVD